MSNAKSIMHSNEMLKQEIASTLQFFLNNPSILFDHTRNNGARELIGKLTKKRKRMDAGAKRALSSMTNDENGTMSVVRSFISPNDQDAAANVIDRSFRPVTPRGIFRERVLVELQSKFQAARARLDMGHQQSERDINCAYNFRFILHDLGLKYLPYNKYPVHRDHGIEVIGKYFLLYQVPHGRYEKKPSLKRLRLGWKINGLRGYSRANRQELVSGLMTL